MKKQTYILLQIILLTTSCTKEYSYSKHGDKFMLSENLTSWYKPNVIENELDMTTDTIGYILHKYKVTQEGIYVYCDSLFDEGLQMNLEYSKEFYNNKLGMYRDRTNVEIPYTGNKVKGKYEYYVNFKKFSCPEYERVHFKSSELISNDDWDNTAILDSLELAELFPNIEALMYTYKENH